MATIREAKSGWWQAIVRRKGFPDQSRTFEKKFDAEQWARDIENKIDRDVFVDRSEAEATSLHNALERYEREVSVKKDGHEVEKVRIAVWKRHPLAKRSLASLKPADFAKWLDVRLEQTSKTGNKIAPSTARKELAIISHLYTVAAKRWGMAVTNPIEKIEIPTEDNSRDRRFEDGEEEQLMAELADSGCGDRANTWMLPLVNLAIETAARQSELLALKWQNIDLARLSIRVHGKERKDGKSRTKNKAKYRDVPISPAAKALLEALPRSIDGRVFPTSASAVKQSYTRAVKRARSAYMAECAKTGAQPYPTFMIDLTFHDLRHEGTSRLAEIYDIHELMKITGHEDTRMLARYYHPRVEDLAKKMWVAKK